MVHMQSYVGQVVVLVVLGKVLGPREEQECIVVRCCNNITHTRIKADTICKNGVVRELRRIPATIPAQIATCNKQFGRRQTLQHQL
jgi:hypothetical protein